MKQEILQGSAASVLATLAANSIQAVITSPPYFGLREYTTEAGLISEEIGREATLDEYLGRMATVFKEVHRVLRNDGVLWLNLGDSYRHHNLQGVPWRVVFALQSQGWLLRSDIIWNKPNAMPSSVKNRPTTAHEYLFMLTKSKDYYYDADAIREPHVTFSETSKMKGGRNHFGKENGTPEVGKNGGNVNLHDGRWDQAFHPMGRNKRTVWDIPLGKFRGAHFAVFPEKLVETCLLASTKPEDLVLDPFAGAGTTGVVAKKFNRAFTGVELSPEFAELARRRIHTAVGQYSLL